MAYIPSYSLILSKLAESQGKGAYRVEQSVQFKSNTVMETWWVEPEGLRLHVQTRKKDPESLYLRFLYKKRKKIFRGENNKIQSQSISPYHLEWPFHMRKASKLQKLFTLWQMAPSPLPEREPSSPSDSFIRLSRKGGTIQYKISQGKGQLWIEQDEFVIRGWKWPTGASLQAQNYQLYPGRLFFPETRILRHSATHSVRIKLKTIQKQKPNKQRLSQKWLKKRNHYPENLPDQDIIRTFYEKFR